MLEVQQVRDVLGRLVRRVVLVDLAVERDQRRDAALARLQDVAQHDAGQAGNGQTGPASIRRAKSGGMTTAMRATMRPYSTAVAPRSVSHAADRLR